MSSPSHAASENRRAKPRQPKNSHLLSCLSHGPSCLRAALSEKPTFHVPSTLDRSLSRCPSWPGHSLAFPQQTNLPGRAGCLFRAIADLGSIPEAPPGTSPSQARSAPAPHSHHVHGTLQNRQARPWLVLCHLEEASGSQMYRLGHQTTAWFTAGNGPEVVASPSPHTLPCGVKQISSKNANYS